MRASNRSHWQHKNNVGFHLKIAATLSNEWGPLKGYLACVTLTVQDLAKSQSYLKSVGIDSVPGPKESLLLNPKDTCGVSLELVDGLD